MTTRISKSAILRTLLVTTLGLAACSSGTPTGAGGSTDSSASNADQPPVEHDTLASKGEFTFFVISLAFIKSKAPCTNGDGQTCLGGFGGDLRNGKSNGIDGADALCAEAAEKANPGDRHLWRAFLSASDYQGAVLNAIDRIGDGPWYSAPPRFLGKSSYASEGLLLAADKSGLLGLRPDGDPTTIVYHGINQSLQAGDAQDWPFSQCLLNEHGDCTQADGDTHDTLTGSKKDGTYAGSPSATCDDWTDSGAGSGQPVFGHAWPHKLGDTDTTADWINTGEAGEFACGAVINVSSTNFMSGGGMGAGGDVSYAGGVGSAGGYGAFYCFATVTGSE